MIRRLLILPALLLPSVALAQQAAAPTIGQPPNPVASAPATAKPAEPTPVVPTIGQPPSPVPVAPAIQPVAAPLPAAPTAVQPAPPPLPVLPPLPAMPGEEEAKRAKAAAMPVIPVMREGQFTWDTLMFHAVALEKSKYDFDKFAEPYMKMYHPDKWLKYHKDEFERDTRIEEAKQEFKQKVQQFNINGEYSLVAQYKFGEYDFDKGVFEFKPFNATSHFADKRKVTYGFPSITRVYFNNSQAIDGLEMPEEKAKEFIARRRTDKGDIDRTIWGRLVFSVYGFKSGSSTTPEVRLLAKIRSFTVYDSQLQDKVIAEYRFD